jgi:hypothetical protein
LAARRDEHATSLAGPLRTASEDAITLLRTRARQSAQVPRASGDGAGSAVIGQPTAATGRGSGSPVIGQPADRQVIPRTVSQLTPDSHDLGQTPTVPQVLPGERVRGKDVAAYAMKLIEEADEHPDAEFEISWRIVEP